MTTRDKILKFFRKHKEGRTADLVKLLGISRQTTAEYLRDLVEEGVLAKSGSTRAAVYTERKSTRERSQQNIHFIRKLKNLREEVVFDEISLALNLKKALSPNVFSIVSYAFTEMLNNAIDHSHSDKADVRAEIKEGNLQFIVQDFGIGAFENVRKNFKLHDELEAVHFLLKGKQTTFPEAHSGQGIFFTSRIADHFILASHKTKLNLNNIENDISVGEKKFEKGTSVFFSIKARSRKKLPELFEKFSNSEYQFDKNEVKLKLMGEEALVSRSQAKRLLVGLEKFERIVLDFEGIHEMGQGFADEVFRVFLKRHSRKTIEYINANRALEFMIQRVKTEEL